MNATASTNLWGIVLGASERRPEWRRRQGRGAGPSRPDARIRETVDRATLLIPRERLVAVLDREQARREEGLADVQRVVQPAYRGSAASTFLPALKIVWQDPQAVVAVLPSDPCVACEARLLAAVEKAACAATARAALPVVIGAEPEGVASPLPWIEPGPLVEGLEALGVRTVRGFYEAPSPTEAARLYEGEGLLNTFVIVARARTLLDLGARYLPDVLESLEPLERAFGGPEERLLTEAVYEGMPYANISHALFARSRSFAVLPAPNLAWKDGSGRGVEALAS